eukprot:Nk52_evm4s270 gene=Nk52_evmTU4s270
MTTKKMRMSCPSPATALNESDDVRILENKPLIPPQILFEDIPLESPALECIRSARNEAVGVLNGRDDRLIVIVGPCSIHDVDSALKYAELLRGVVDKYATELMIIMRVYFEKPRTTVGWKGLINDPDLNESYNVNKGLRIARQLLIDINAMGMPVACEFLDTISPQFIGDLVSWGAIGARTTESQVHRELASGLSCPIGFKNGTGGSVKIAVDAIGAACHPHRFLGVTKQGLAAIVKTAGNPNCHVILRGGTKGPNYQKEHVKSAVEACEKGKVKPLVMIDCSHGNSLKVHSNQIKVAKDVAEQVSGGDATIVGVMIESNLVEGRQDLPKGNFKKSDLVFGKSITDACVSWEQTLPMFDVLAEAVRNRRKS